MPYYFIEEIHELDYLIRKYYILHMKTLPVGKLKTKFSQVLNDVKSSEEVVITYGKKKEKIAVIIPYKNFKKTTKLN